MPPGVRLAICDEVDSTNSEALRRYQAGDHGPLWIWAASQHSGRGRGGRPWVSEPGNLYASLLLTGAGDGGRNLTELCFVAALAVFDAVAEMLPADRRPDLALKWPNDLMLGGAKLAGILLETFSGHGGQGCVVIVGVGLNLKTCPAEGLYQATSLADHGCEATPVAALEHLAAQFGQWHARWDGGQRFADILAAWKSRAAGIGGAVTIRGRDRDLTGTFTGLDGDGALILHDDKGATHKVLSGDLFLDPGNSGFHHPEGGAS